MYMAKTSFVLAFTAQGQAFSTQFLHYETQYDPFERAFQTSSRRTDIGGPFKEGTRHAYGLSERHTKSPFEGYIYGPFEGDT